MRNETNLYKIDTFVVHNMCLVKGYMKGNTILNRFNFFANHVLKI